MRTRLQKQKNWCVQNFHFFLQTPKYFFSFLIVRCEQNPTDIHNFFCVWSHLLVTRRKKIVATTYLAPNNARCLYLILSTFHFSPSNVLSFFLFISKKSTRKSTVPLLMTGMKAIHLKIETTSPCSSPTLKRGNADLDLEESRSAIL